MRNIYLTAVPLQARFDLEQLDYGSTRPDGRGTPTRFPIIQVIRDTMAPGDEAQVIAIRQENKDTARKEESHAEVTDSQRRNAPL